MEPPPADLSLMTSETTAILLADYLVRNLYLDLPQHGAIACAVMGETILGVGIGRGNMNDLEMMIVMSIHLFVLISTARSTGLPRQPLELHLVRQRTAQVARARLPPPWRGYLL